MSGGRAWEAVAWVLHPLYSPHLPLQPREREKNYWMSGGWAWEAMAWVLPPMYSPHLLLQPRDREHSKICLLVWHRLLLHHQLWTKASSSTSLIKPPQFPPATQGQSFYLALLPHHSKYCLSPQWSDLILFFCSAKRFKINQRLLAVTLLQWCQKVWGWAVAKMWQTKPREGLGLTESNAAQF